MEDAKTTAKGENPVVIEDQPKKKLRKHDNSEIELLKDDLRVVVLHPDQHLMVCGVSIELKFVCAPSGAVHTSQVGLGLRGNSLITLGIPSMAKEPSLNGYICTCSN